MSKQVMVLRSGDRDNPCLTPVDLIDGLPDLSSYSEPSLSILQEAFIAGDYEVVEVEEINLME